MDNFRRVKVSDLKSDESQMRFDVGMARRRWARGLEILGIMSETELRRKINKLQEQIDEIEAHGFLMEEEREKVGLLYEQMDRLQQKLDKLEDVETEWSPENETKYGGPKDIGAADWWKNGGTPPWEKDAA